MLNLETFQHCSLFKHKWCFVESKDYKPKLPLFANSTQHFSLDAYKSWLASVFFTPSLVSCVTRPHLQSDVWDVHAYAGDCILLIVLLKTPGSVSDFCRDYFSFCEHMKQTPISTSSHIHPMESNHNRQQVSAPHNTTLPAMPLYRTVR